MSNESTPPPDGLQFDKAQFASGAALNCALCKTPIQDVFFQANGKTICAACEKGLKQSLQTSMSAAIPLSLGAGLVAGVAGFLLYWVVTVLTKAYWGIIAVAVGWMVGSAVRWGSKGMGGPVFQAIAVVITYLAIVCSYLPFLIPRRESLTVAVQSALKAPTEGIFSLLILGFAIYEAWSLNRRAEVQISGPFTVARPT
jgi:hypothetical protein